MKILFFAFILALSSLSYASSVRRHSVAGWTVAEDEMLTKMANALEGKNWEIVASFIEGRKPAQCRNRWQKILNPQLVKGPWSPEEDDKLKECMELVFNGKNWAKVAKAFGPSRNDKQCRERWKNHLAPFIKKTSWTSYEDFILRRTQAKYPNQWALIAELLPGRSSNAIKNRWYSALRRVSSSNSASEARGKAKRKMEVVQVEAEHHFSEPPAPAPAPAPKKKKAKVNKNQQEEAKAYLDGFVNFHSHFGHPWDRIELNKRNKH